MIYESLTHYLTGIMEKLFLHTVILLNTRLSVLLHLGPQIMALSSGLTLN